MTNEEIVMLIKNGTETKKNMGMLYEKNIGMIKKIALSYRGYSELEDLMQEGYIGLNEAVLRYEPDAGCKFISYATIWIKEAMLSYISQKGIMIKIPQNIYWGCKKYNRLLQKYGGNRADKREKIIRELGVTNAEFELIKRANDMINVYSTNKAIKESEEEIEIQDAIAGNIDVENDVIESMMNTETAEILWQQVHKLEQVQAEIIEMRYKRKMTVQEIANNIETSVSTVREKEKRALITLRHNKNIKDMLGFEEKKSTNLYKGVGVSTYKYTGMSSTEFETLKMYMS